MKSHLYDSNLEVLDSENLKKIQNEKFIKQISYLFQNSPFYQKKFNEEKISIDDIKTIDDIIKLPFTEKEELRDALVKQPPILGLNQTADGIDIIRIHSSSGTTGRPTYVGLSKKDAKQWNDTVAKAFWTAGIREKDVVAHCFNYSMFVGGIANHLGCEEIGATMVPIGIGQSSRLIRMILDLGITVIIATPSYIMYLADIVRKELGIEPEQLGVKKIICGGEPGGGVPSTRALIESTWNAQCFEIMGMVDIHPVLGAECEYKNGMHFMHPELIFTEIIDPDTGELMPIKPGIRGEAIYSHLDREANPILRFRSHDVIEILGTECSCGRTGYRYRVIGRTDDMLIIKGVNVYPSAIEDILRGLDELTGEFCILLEKEGIQQDYLYLFVEYENTIDISNEYQNIKEKIKKKISESLLFKARIELVEENSLPKFEHKAKRIYKKFLGEKIPFQN